jgi:hypothetical protein
MIGAFYHRIPGKGSIFTRLTIYWHCSIQTVSLDIPALTPLLARIPLSAPGPCRACQRLHGCGRRAYDADPDDARTRVCCSEGSKPGLTAPGSCSLRLKPIGSGYPRWPGGEEDGEDSYQVAGQRLPVLRQNVGDRHIAEERLNKGLWRQ